MTAPRPSPGRLRRRLAIAFALVGAVSSGLLAIGSYAVVERARTTDAQDRALVQAKANLQLARSAASVEQLQRRLASRPGFATVPVVDGKAQPGTLPVPPDLSRLVGDGNLAYRWSTVRGHRYLVVGAPSRGAELYFFFDEQQLQDDLDQLRVILIGAWLVLAALSALVGIVLARRVLAPVGEASAAARALAEGLLETRLPSRGADEFGEWASSFNQMADALEAKIDALSLAREREQRFTADVAHELRTPLTALVNEAAILRDQIDQMSPDAQRASRMLTADVTRLSRLVEDLLEISRLDAGAEPVRAEPVDLGTARAGRARRERMGGLGRRRRRRPARGVRPSAAGARDRQPDRQRAAPRRRSGGGLRARGGRPLGADRDRSRARHPGGRAGIGVRQVCQGRRRRRAGAAWAWRSPASTRRRWAGKSGPRASQGQARPSR